MMLGSRTRWLLGAWILASAPWLAGCGDDAPHIPSGSVQVLAPPHEVQVALPDRAAGVNRGIRVVQKNQAIPSDWIPTPWIVFNLDRSSSSLRITWTYGECGKDGRDEIVFIDEQSSKVVIDVWDNPNDGGSGTSDCPAVGLTGAATVKLSRPLGNRALLMHTVQPQRG